MINNLIMNILGSFCLVWGFGWIAIVFLTDGGNKRDLNAVMIWSSIFVLAGVVALK